MRFLLIFMTAILPLSAGVMERGKVSLLCHRMANRDVPENTLESLEEAARLGCDIVEIDIARTLDGVLVMQHDGPIDRLMNGTGMVEQLLFDELRLYDAGSWMGPRFQGIKMPLFEDTLRLAKRLGLRIHLDVKTKGAATEVLEVVRQEGMLDRVRFGGNWDDVKAKLPPGAIEEFVPWTPEMSVDDIRKLQDSGKFVVAGFSANEYELDLARMRKAVAAGVDAMNVDHPRLGAEAIGKPIEGKVRRFIALVKTGAPMEQVQALRELSRFRDFDLTQFFVATLKDSNADVSRAAAVALVFAKRSSASPAIVAALKSTDLNLRRNGAWALGMLAGSADDANALKSLTALLKDDRALVLREALFAVARYPRAGGINGLEKLCDHEDPMVAAGAATAVARHLGRASVVARVAERLRKDITQPDAKTMERGLALYGAYMQVVKSYAMLADPDAERLLVQELRRDVKDFSITGAQVAALRLWDLAADDPTPLIASLSSGDAGVRQRAQWALIKAGTRILPQVRMATKSTNAEERRGAAVVLEWLEKTAAVEASVL